MSVRPQSYMAGDDVNPLSAQPDTGLILPKLQNQQRAGYQIEAGSPALQRSASTVSTKVNPANNAIPLRSNTTLTKKASLRKRTSLRRSKSGRSLKAGSMAAGDDDDFYSVFHTPIPTTGSPTEILANRFNAWRKFLKDLITYFREVQASYEARSKALVKVSNVQNNTQIPSNFLSQGGIEEANNVLRNYHKHSISEANKAKDIINDVINQLNGLRGDLNQKIKEIKSLSGDFKNSCDKEKEGTRKAVIALEEALHTSSVDPSAASGKNDPFIVRLHVDRQVEKQIEEENYLHRAYLNLEGSGRELESIVVGEIQKAYNALAGILKREADSATDTIEELRVGPIAMPKDHEWAAFVESDPHFVSPDVPLRKVENISYPGKYNPAAADIRAGSLERKSKYLKSYTAGWYVLSPTHLHEFKSPDHIHTQQPVMSLCLADQKLGSHSQPGSSSDKFSLKGKQTGGIHRGHSWVFRAESYDTMMAWYEDIRSLTEKSPEERKAFVRQHARSVSGGTAPSMSSDGMEEDDADTAPYQAHQPSVGQVVAAERPMRPQPGGRFPSEIREPRQPAPLSPSSPSEGSFVREEPTFAAIAPATVLDEPSAINDANVPTARPVEPIAAPAQPYTSPPVTATPATAAAATPITAAVPAQAAPDGLSSAQTPHVESRDWIAPAAGGLAGGLAGGALVASAHQHQQDDDKVHEPVASAVVDAPTERELPSQSALSALPPISPATTLSSAMVPASNQAASPADASDTGLHRTGHLFPSVIRHDTSMSVSDLHIPGEYPPRRTSAE